MSSVLNFARSEKIANLKVMDLIVVGLGAMVGGGVFTLTGTIAANFSGPAVVISYIIAGMATMVIALPYAELASAIPTSGSIYSYTQIAFGELFAWMALGVLTLELIFGGVFAASAISSYLVSSLEQSLHITFAPQYLSGPFDGGIVNLPASIVAIFFGFLTLLGAEGKNLLNTILVFVKILTVTLFVILAAPHFDLENLKPFMHFGAGKIFAGGAILFAAFSGFSVIPTFASSCRNPSRDITLGIIGSVSLTLLIYVVVAVLAVGLVHYSELNSPDALIRALWGKGSNYGGKLLSYGIMLSIIAVLMLMLQAIARVFVIVSRDGLLPEFFQRLSPTTGKPIYGIIFCTFLFAVLAGVMNFAALAQTASIGALGDYTIAMLLVLFFRRFHPELERKFKCPWVNVFVLTGVSFSLYLIYQQVVQSEVAYWKISVYWLIAFFVFYWTYAFFRPRSIRS